MTIPHPARTSGIARTMPRDLDAGRDNIIRREYVDGPASSVHLGDRRRNNGRSAPIVVLLEFEHYLPDHDVLEINQPPRLPMFPVRFSFGSEVFQLRQAL